MPTACRRPRTRHAPFTVAALAFLTLALLTLALLTLAGGAPARADEGAAAAAAGTDPVLEKTLDVMRLRMEGLLGEAEVLARLGRLDEALAVYREIGEVYQQGMAGLTGLTGRAEPSRHAASGVRGAPGTDVAPAALAGATGTVDGGLAWLAAHQAPDGSWRGAKPLYDVGVTGLAALAFLGAGHVPAAGTPYGGVVERALRWLIGRQDPDGCVGTRAAQQYMYNHLIASLALVEGFGMSSAPWLREAAVRATAFTQAARNPYLAWRYGVRPGDNDTSVTAWAVMGLRSAQLLAGEQALEVDPAAFQGALAWVDKVTDADSGRVGYLQRGTGPARPMEAIDRFPSERSEAMTAAGMLIRVLSGASVDSEVMRKGAGLLHRLPPVWNEATGDIDMMYWYYGSLAAFQVGGPTWRLWSEHLRRAVVATQRRDGSPSEDAGSWDPVGAWGPEGGRVYSTALMTLCAEVLDRHDRVIRR